MFNLSAVANENNEEHNSKWPYIPDHLYRMLTTGGSASGKANALLNWIKKQYSDNLIVKISLYAKELNEPKYQFLIKKSEDARIKHLNYPKAFIEYSQHMDDVYNNISDYNSTRNRNTLIVFDDMIADIMTNEAFQAIVKELFTRRRKLSISLVFITISFFFFSKKVRLTSSHYLIMKIDNKRELQQIAINYSTDFDYKGFIKIYKNVHVNQIIFWLLILHYQLMIL